MGRDHGTLPPPGRRWPTPPPGRCWAAGRRWPRAGPSLRYRAPDPGHGGGKNRPAGRWMRGPSGGFGENAKII